MRKKRRERGQRRSRFDDDDVYTGPDPYRERPRQSFQRTPREDATPAGPAIDATVKWFNPEKGFGFVELGDGSGDAFLHIAVLQRRCCRKLSYASRSAQVRKALRSQR